MWVSGIARDEMKDTEPLHLEQIAPEAVKQAIERILGKRNNYSKTDPDASFMRMKEDHMKCRM